MMGPAVGRQDRLFYAFDLDERIPADHLLRRIDAVLDLSWLRGELKSHYSMIGRPSICPEPMIRMLLVGYGAGKMLGWLVERGIDPHIPVWDKGKRSDGTFSREDFVYDKDRNVYICPKGNFLKTTGRQYEGKTFRYRASKLDCDRCPLKMRCCPKMPARYVPRDINEEARGYTRVLMKTDAYGASSVDRKKIEGLFGEAKHVLSMVRLRGQPETS